MEQKRSSSQGPDEQMPGVREVFLYFILLGFINIGGPVAQITMMYNKMVERSHWLSKDRFVRIMGFAHMLPGPEALQLAIYVGYLKKGVLGAILAGLTFIIPGAFVMLILSRLYVTYGNLPQVNDVLYVLKPAVLGIIAAGIIRLGQAAIKNAWLAVILIGAIVTMLFFRVDFLIVLLIAGLVNLLFTEGLPRLKRVPGRLPILVVSLTSSLLYIDERWLQMAWLFLKTGLFSFGGAYASLAFVQQGAVDQYHWLTTPQLLDGVALSVATPGPFMLFTTFVGYLAGGIAGAVIATFFVFLPSFIFVIIGAHYIEQVRNNRFIQAFLSGVSAAVVGIILVVSLKLIPGTLIGTTSMVITILAFAVITFFRVDVARVAISAIIIGIGYAAWHGIR
ncbi:MAG TPA: chromate efflux transporter [Anaerolineales bacterium]|nr:chromate efflux transporter [Anaerolineales bacterium]